ncbi:oligopeptide/dipeptide ABC transporter, ATP-binding protein, C-terminal domain [Rubrobacter radiotolerans]|uniref:ABC transporter ATP-binding protein n=1 Tax=Rubrobacter radiotolerans TaxID=42256 RepID=A0A023X187_RUBRA|nr:ABC transporter ATP-binding protein [Rubrobacter radiotolerans]AHY46053.1 oligopeptide/dipeptide ABC transporter, ATP-binding protein, C-terminal domain [Rubrobacter radiotolerans]MDX5893463.1 ABC transporter ATP-binding protein [Rubrobacter radiotolerans]SMC03781.1 oligopeptide transport system ATP-binding protein [Rubrobacter radiotolerans DSM 5868]
MAAGRTDVRGSAPGEALLSVRNLEVSFQTYAGEVQAVRDVSFELAPGETLAVVGESGSGKSVAAKSLMGLLPDNARVKSGEAMFEGHDLLKMSERRMQGIRGSRISMVFQDPMTSLDPTMRIGRQLTEGIRKHLGLRGRAARERAVELLKAVHIPNAEKRLRQYPHEFSGGMRQRVVIAIALACDPQVLICDEPTTALDVTIQEQILELLAELQERNGTSIILITHDLGVVAQVAHRVAVMYSGRVIETGTVHDIFGDPKHPYTWGLLTSIPRPDDDRKDDLIPIKGSPPNPLDPPKACPFSARCDYAMKVCDIEMPAMQSFGGETDGGYRSASVHQAACWLHHDLAPNVEPPARVRGGTR